MSITAERSDADAIANGRVVELVGIIQRVERERDAALAELEAVRKLVPPASASA